MKILYCTESSPECFTQNSNGIDIQEKSEIFVIGDLTYCCEALEKNLWLESKMKIITSRMNQKLN